MEKVLHIDALNDVNDALKRSQHQYEYEAFTISLLLLYKTRKKLRISRS